MRTLAALVTLVLAVAAGCGGGDEEAVPPTTTEPPAATATEPAPATTEAPPATTAPPKPEVERVTIRVRGGQPVGGIVRIAVDRGTRVVLEITSDVADEAHLHGYDLSMNLAPGQPNTLSFVAKTPGRFELELHHVGTQIAELTVEP
jgi:small nuclear ribonucleoprotein (snRNP)-like protein